MPLSLNNNKPPQETKDWISNEQGWRKRNLLVDRMYGNILGAHSHHGTPAEEESEDISDKLNCYLRELVIDRLPLGWWKHNKTRLSLLAPLARKSLCPLPSSVASKRIFSVVGTIYEKKRNKLRGENAVKLAAHKLGLLSD